MKRWGVKAAASLAALLAVLALAVPLVLNKYFPPEKVRQLIVTEARKALGREVSLSSVSYGVWKGVSLHEVAISEAPDFKAGRFLEAKDFHVQVRWLPLLEKKLAVDSVSVDGLKLRVVKREDGTYNFSQLGQSAAKAPAGAKAAGGAASVPELSVRKAVVTGGSVEYVDLARKETIAVAPLDAKVSGFALRGAFGVDVSLSAKGVYAGRPIDGKLAYAGKLDLGGQDPQKFFAEFKRLSLEQQGMSVEASGKVSNLSAPKGKVSLSVSGKSGTVASADFSGSAVLSPFSAQGDFSLKTPGFAGSDLAALGAPATLTVPAFKAAGSAVYTGKTLEAKKLRVEGKFGSVDLGGTIRSFDQKKPDEDVDFSASLTLPELSAKDFPQLPPGVSLPPSEVSAKGHLHNDDLKLDSFSFKSKYGKASGSAAARQLLSAKPAVTASADLKLDLPEIKSADAPFLKLPPQFVSPALSVEGSVKYTGEDLALSPLHLRGKAGSVEVSGTVKKLKSDMPEPDLDVSAKLDLPALSAKDVPSASVPADFSLPPSKWDVALNGSLDDLKVKRLRLAIGKNDVEIADAHLAGLRGRTPLFSVLIKCRSFVLDELKKLTADTKELDITGNGFFAVEITGHWPKPILAGKAQFRDIGANVAGLPLTGFSGTASFDEKRIDVPNLKGKVADGELSVDVTIKDYAKRPDIDVEANLTQFDLGRYLKAKTTMAAKQGAEAQAKAEEKHNAEPIDLKGRLTVGRLVHPNAEAQNLKATWQLSSFTPNFKRLGGTATIASNGGKFSNLGAMASQSKLVKILITPLIVVQTISKIGGIKLFPDFNNVAYQELAGDYSFREGMMTVNDSHVYADAGNVTTTGQIDLPREALDLKVTAQVARLAPLEVKVGGTFDKPEHHVNVGKFLAQPVNQLLKNIFKPQ